MALKNMRLFIYLLENYHLLRFDFLENCCALRVLNSTTLINQIDNNKLKKTEDLRSNYASNSLELV